MATFLADELAWTHDALRPRQSPPALALPGMPNFAQRVAGREGNILVVQMKSSAHAKMSAAESIRSLGLAGVGTFSLRINDDPVVRGYIRAAREYIAILDLGRVEYRNDPFGEMRGGDMYERTYYGSNTRPAQLVRDGVGNYFQYESSPDHLLMAWNCDKDFPTALEFFNESFDEPEIPEGSEGIISVPADLDADFFTSRLGASSVVEAGKTLVVDAPTKTLLEYSRKNPHDILLARLAFKDSLELTWLAEHRKFEDRDGSFAEVGVMGSPNLDIRQTRQFAQATGVPQFFEEARCQVQVRQSGVPKMFDF